MRLTALLRYGVLAIVFGVAVAASTPTGEYVPPGETAAMQRIVDSFQTVVTREFKQSGHANRDAHAKGQGCVRASVAIRSGLPAALRHGVFAKPHTYRAWIRFSNGSGEIQADNVPDGRGMAIKLTGVSGPKLIADEKYTQDFVMIDFPVFFVPDVAQYELLATAIEKGNPLAFLASHPESAKIAAETQSHPTHDMLANRYFSMTPYRLGNAYVKFDALPVSCATGTALHPANLSSSENVDYLRSRMETDLARAPACFALQLQPRTDPATMPIENDSIVWDETKAPFVTAAAVTIPEQRFDSPQQQSFCEDLSYNPWHGTTDFRPVGGINRLRLFVYRAISQLRHRLNDAPTIEPTGYETFPN